MDRTRPIRIAFACLVLCSAGCTSTPSYEKPKGTPFDELTLDKLIHWPAGQEYLEGRGEGRPPEGETDVDKRRKTAREGALIEAQRQLIAQLEKLVARDKIRDLLRKAEISRMTYAYDDGCVVTLKLLKEAVEGDRPME